MSLFVISPGPIMKALVMTISWQGSAELIPQTGCVGASTQFHMVVWTRSVSDQFTFDQMPSLFHDLWVLCQPLATAALSRTLFMFSSFNNMLKFAIVTTVRAMRRRRSRRRKRRKPRRELNGDLVWVPCPSLSKLAGETSGDFSQLIILFGNCDLTDEKKQPLSLSVFDL